jgi:hypothetical protein
MSTLFSFVPLVLAALITYLLVIALGIMGAVVLPFFLRGANG